MKSMFLVAVFFFLMSAAALGADGMIHVESKGSVKETASRLEEILKEKGVTIFSRISHSEGATKVGIELLETELIIFGNPKIGSPLMKCQHTVAIDLPQKALIWADRQSRVWITYNDPRYLEKRHAISGCEKVILKIEKALAGITRAASGR